MLHSMRSREARRAFEGWLVIFIMVIMLGELYLRSSTPALVALDFAEHNASVQQAVGGVEQARLGWIGHIHYDGNDGWASFKMHLVGTHAKGTMDVTLQRQSGEWNVATGRLVTDTGRVITFSEPSGSDQPRAMN